MKKIFLFAAAAVTMAAGCQKLQEILVNPNDKPVDDDSPVAVTLGTNVANTATTKAAVADLDALKAQSINVYGLKATATDLTNTSNFLLGYNAAQTEPIEVDANFDGMSFDLSKTDIPNTPINTNVFYGGNNEVYNFYGYYVGAARTATRWGQEATAPAKITTTATGTITIPVIIDGQDDILVAKTNKVRDLASATDRSTKLERVYSAYSARRGVTPNLLFEHQLTQLTFKLENGTNLPTGTSLEVKSLTVKSKAKADIVITNDSDPVLTPAVLDNDVVSFAFPTTGTDPVHTFTNTDAVSLGGSIMVIPGETVYDLIVDLVQKNGSDEIVGSSQSVDLDITLGGAQFKAGYSYEVTVKVYAAQAVVLDVSIVDWKAGESIYVDNDNDDDVAGVDPTKLYATPDYVRSTDTELVFSVNVPDGEYYNVQAALSTDPNNYDSNAEWVSVVGLTKAETGTVTFTNFYAEKVYYCHLRYTDTDVTVDEDTEFTDAAKPAEDNYLVSPAFEIEKGYLVENSWESYSKLPQFYLNRYPEITEATWEDAAPTDLPWLAVECTPTDKEVVINVYKDGSLIKTFQGAGWIPYNGLITISGEELGYATLETGVYDVKVDGISAPAITVS